MDLTARDEALLRGEGGQANRLAMDLLVAMGEAEGATHLIDIEAAHVDGCLYLGQAGLDFVLTLVDGGGRVKVPTTLNVSSLDLLHPDLYRGDPATAEAARSVMDAYVDLGCLPTWTCAPYQLPSRPGLGQQIAWGESNAIVFANSVLGARTNRYGDFMDICCALTGRAPFSGLHTEEGRRATVHIVLNAPDRALDSDLLYPLLGHVVGQTCGTRVAVIVGLDARADEDRLKALGAAAATAGSVGMFHAVGVTPEAPSLSAALAGENVEVVSVDSTALQAARDELTTATGSLGAVSVGTPHMSIAELRTLASLAAGRKTAVPFYVNTSRDVLSSAEQAGLGSSLEAFGATVVTDTCTYVTPIMKPVVGYVMTNSAKWAYYAPANLGVTVGFGSLAECVESAIAGQRVAAEDLW